MRALFMRGAFTAADAAAAGATLQAYAIGLLPFVLMRSATVTFLARGDTWTPVKALFFAVLVNVALKILLHGPHAQVGLAFATSIGGWVNLVLLIWFAQRAGLFAFDPEVVRSAMRLAAAGLALALVLWLARQRRCGRCSAGRALQDELALALLAVIGARGLWRAGDGAVRPPLVRGLHDAAARPRTAGRRHPTRPADGRAADYAPHRRGCVGRRRCRTVAACRRCRRARRRHLDRPHRIDQAGAELVRRSEPLRAGGRGSCGRRRA